MTASIASRRRSRRVTATIERQRSTPDRTRSSATSSRNRCWDCDNPICHPERSEGPAVVLDKMNFDPSEEQRLFAASIERFVARDYTFEARRSIVASHDGYSRDVWAAFAELGMLGVAIPTEYGGLGGGAVDLTSVMEAIGEALIVEPYLATVMGARLVALAGTVEQKNSL